MQITVLLVLLVAAAAKCLLLVLSVDSLMWSSVEIEPEVAARTGHTAICCPTQFKTREYNNVLLFGGGDNEGKFFSDLFCVSVPTSHTRGTARKPASNVLSQKTAQHCTIST